MSARPVASTTTETSATLAPPSLSGTCPKNRRAATKDAAKTLNRSQTGLQWRSADSNELKAIMVPKPMLLSAAPKPGLRTPRAPLRSAGGHHAEAGQEP